MGLAATLSWSIFAPHFAKQIFAYKKPWVTQGFFDGFILMILILALYLPKQFQLVFAVAEFCLADLANL